MNKITIEKLPSPVHSGDWHDKPLKWAVLGPDGERQVFSTRKGAEVYRRIRLSANSQVEAIKAYAI